MGIGPCFLIRVTSTHASYRRWIQQQHAAWNHLNLDAPGIAEGATAFVNCSALIALLTTSSHQGISFLTSKDSCSMSLVVVGGVRDGARKG